MGKRARERRRQRQIAETAQPTTGVLVETSDQAVLSESTGRAVSVRIINPGWGSSGYYSEELLERDGPRVFGPGTHMFFDHPTATEAAERPERSLRDLAGVLESGARWVPDHPDGPGLYAEAIVFEAFRPAIREAADHIGLSIRARGGYREHGEAEGRTGRIITSLDEALSVDFVTAAGRGGAIVDLLESAREQMRPGDTPLEEARNIGEWFQSRIHLRFTEIADEMFGDGRLTKPERIALSSAIGSALDAFDDDLTDAAPQLYDRDLWDQPQATTITTTTEEADMADLTDDQLSKIGEAAGAAAAAAIKPLIEGGSSKPATESKTDVGDDIEMSESERKRAEKLLYIEATDAASKAFAEGGPLAEAGKTLPDSWVRGLVEAAAKTAPHDDQLDLDRDKLVEGLKAAADQRVTEFAEATGAGRVTGMGGTLTEGDGDRTDELAAEFQRLGLSESAAKTAAAGR